MFVLRIDFSRLKNEDGGITIFTVIWFSICLSIMIMCIDVGKMMISQHELQAAADAGALAGASTFTMEYGFDSSGNITESKAILNKSAADVLSKKVMDRNFSYKNITAQDIKVTSIETKVKDSGNFGKPEYSILIKADVKMFIMGTFGNGVTKISVISRADVNLN